VWSDFELARRKERGDNMEKEKADKIKATGAYYRLMLEHVRKVLADIKRVVPGYDPKQGYELAGFVWFQGFNDLVSGWTYEKGNQPGGYDLYSELLCHFIRDVRKNLSAPKMPFVIGVMGIGGVKEDAKPGSMQYFRKAMAAPASLPEFNVNVMAVPTAPYWDDDLEKLRTRLEALWPKVDAMAAEEVKKNPKMTGPESEAFKMKAQAEHFTPEEWKRLRAGASNGGYHYLGAAKIMAPIGKAFAEAMVSFQKTQRQDKQ
jgi:alpha-galactosidase